MIVLKYPEDEDPKLSLAVQLRAEFPDVAAARMALEMIVGLTGAEVIPQNNPAIISLTLRSGYVPPTPQSTRRFVGILCEGIPGKGAGSRKIHALFMETEGGLQAQQPFWTDRTSGNTLTSLMLGKSYYVIAATNECNGEVTLVRGVETHPNTVRIECRTLGTFKLNGNQIAAQGDVDRFMAEIEEVARTAFEKAQ